MGGDQRRVRIARFCSGNAPRIVKLEPSPQPSPAGGRGSSAVAPSRSGGGGTTYRKGSGSCGLVFKDDRIGSAACVVEDIDHAGAGREGISESIRHRGRIAIGGCEGVMSPLQVCIGSPCQFTLCGVVVDRVHLVARLKNTLFSSSQG